MTIETEHGATATLASSWTFVPAGVISSIAPASGQGGALVTITGTSLLGGASNVSHVLVDGINVTRIESLSNTEIVVEVAVQPAGDVTAVEGSVRVVADSGAFVESLGFTYTPAPIVTSVEPLQGQKGTRVTISGSNLRQGASAVSAVLLAGRSATVVSEDDSEVVVEAPDGTALGPLPVAVQASSGASVLSDIATANFTFLERGGVPRRWAPPGMALERRPGLSEATRASKNPRSHPQDSPFETTQGVRISKA